MCTILLLFSTFLHAFLLMCLDFLLHLYFLITALLVEQLRFDATQHLGLFRALLWLTCLPLALPLLIVQTSPMELGMTFHILILRHLVLRGLSVKEEKHLIYYLIVKLSGRLNDIKLGVLSGRPTLSHELRQPFKSRDSVVKYFTLSTYPPNIQGKVRQS
uniref:Uncharacterized protein n=1 Tax=Nyssomyia neivai TaxID=330878 RepID=A0A1L8D6V4_9DIPT